MGIWADNHPRLAQVRDRRWNQNDRISNGLSDGSLNGCEAADLQARQQQIAQQRECFQQSHGGHITKAEQRQLNQQLNALSQNIWADRHN